MQKTWKNMENGVQKGAKIKKNPEKMTSKNRCEKWWEKDANERKGAYAAAPRGRLQFKKTPPEVTYINRKKTKRRYPTCKKTQKGANNLEKHQTDDQRKVKYEGKS